MSRPTIIAALLLAAGAACRGAPPPEELPAAEPPSAYSCEADPSISASVAPRDTAGWGVRIRAAFPGWHLSTEREIACRFPLSDGATPAMYHDGWGSGRAWWIGEGDFDGDGGTDHAVLLTRDADAYEDLLAVFFADGKSAEVASPGGWGVALGPRKGELLESCCEDAPPVRLAGDAITLVYWEKAAEAYHWKDGRFEVVSTAD